MKKIPKFKSEEEAARLPPLDQKPNQTAYRLQAAGHLCCLAAFWRSDGLLEWFRWWNHHCRWRSEYGRQDYIFYCWSFHSNKQSTFLRKLSASRLKIFVPGWHTHSRLLTSSWIRHIFVVNISFRAKRDRSQWPKIFSFCRKRNDQRDKRSIERAYY